VYIIFPQYSPSCTPDKNCFALLFSIFILKMTFLFI
jgi:hypothetical protein